MAGRCYLLTQAVPTVPPAIGGKPPLDTPKGKAALPLRCALRSHKAVERRGPRSGSTPGGLPYGSPNALPRKYQKLIFPSFWGEAVQLRSSWAAGGLCPPEEHRTPYDVFLRKKKPWTNPGRGHSPARHRRSGRSPALPYPPIRKKIIVEN